MRSRNPEALGREKDEEAAKIRQDAEKLEAEVLSPPGLFNAACARPYQSYFDHLMHLRFLPEFMSTL